MLGWAVSSLSAVPCSSDGRDAGALPRSALGCRVPHPRPCSCHVRSAGHSAVPAVLIAPVFQPRRPAAWEALWPLCRCSPACHSATLSCAKCSCSRATATASASVRLQLVTGFCVELCLCGLGWLAVSPQPLLLAAEALFGLPCNPNIVLGRVRRTQALQGPSKTEALLPFTSVGVAIGCSLSQADSSGRLASGDASGANLSCMHSFSIISSVPVPYSPFMKPVLAAPSPVPLLLCAKHWQNFKSGSGRAGLECISPCQLCRLSQNPELSLVACMVTTFSPCTALAKQCLGPSAAI